MTKRNDKQMQARLRLKKEILRNLSTDELTAVVGGLLQSDPPGPCPRSRNGC